MNKKGDFGPWEATAGPTPEKPFMRPMMDPRGDGTDAPEGWFKNVDELPKQDAPPGWFKNVDAPPADGKDIPDGWMKSIDPPISEQMGAAVKSAASSAADELSEVAKFAKESLTHLETIHLVAETVDHAHEWGIVPGIADDVVGQLSEQIELMREHGVVGLNASVQMTMEQAKELAQEITTGAEELGEKFKAGAQELGEKGMAGAQELEEKAMAGAQVVKDTLNISSNETLDRMARDDVKPETDQNKVLKEVHQQDVVAEANATNLRMEAQLRQREKELGKTSAEIESAAAAFVAHAQSVDRQMQPPAQPQAITQEVQTVPANTPGPPIVIPPSTPAVAPITPSINP